MHPRLFFRQFPMTRLLALLVCAAATPPAMAAAADVPEQVTVYRCTDANDRMTLRDTPCTDGATQQVRNMLRPVDGTPSAPRPTEPTSPVIEPPMPQVIVLRPPQPMYRCVRADGSNYTSDSSEGNPRWVPLWTQGYGPARRGTLTRVQAGDGRGSIEVDSGIDTRQRGRGGYYGAGTWIRDDCRQIPQVEVCGLLTDRRSEIRQRFFNAQPTERERLRGEERSINARLDNDCRT